MTFQQKLDAIVKKNKSFVCVGLDTDYQKIPHHLKKEKYPLFSFNKAIIDATADLVCAYKPNSAFYEAHGSEGIYELKMTCDYIKKKYPHIPIILDAKRADIGSTNQGYTQYAFEYLDVDAITLHPYLGKEALLPFFTYKDKGFFILCRTSNPGASEFQDLRVKGKPLYEIVAHKVMKDWNKNKNCMLVVGATYPKELKKVRSIAPDMTFLIPGIGTQGGDLEKTIQFGLNKRKQGIIITVSRSVIYASDKKDFAQCARQKIEELNGRIFPS